MRDRVKIIEQLNFPKDMPLIEDEIKLLTSLYALSKVNRYIEQYGCDHHYKMLAIIDDLKRGRLYAWHIAPKWVVESLHYRGLLTMSKERRGASHTETTTTWRPIKSALKRFEQLNELRIQLALGVTGNLKVPDEDIDNIPY